MIEAIIGLIIIALLTMLVWLSRQILWKLEAIRRELTITNRDFYEEQSLKHWE